MREQLQIWEERIRIAENTNAILKILEGQSTGEFNSWIQEFSRTVDKVLRYIPQLAPEERMSEATKLAISNILAILKAPSLRNFEH